MSKRASPSTARRRRWPRLRRVALRIVWGAAALLGLYYLGCLGALLLLARFDPPTTGVQIQRRVESWLGGGPYAKRHTPVGLDRIADHLEHAVVAAEDSRFFSHPGVDWDAIEQAVEDNLERGRAWRGGATITQQLVKNLFMTTHSSWIRKGLELPLAYMAELTLSKQRILELYLDEIEWGPGVYGAEAAAQHHWGVPAAALTREQAAGLAACIPAPRRSKAPAMQRSREAILRRMAEQGW